MTTTATTFPPVRATYTGPTILCQAIQGWPTGKMGYTSRCWNLWTTSKISYSDTITLGPEREAMSMIGPSTEVHYAPSGLRWAHTAREFKDALCCVVRYESTQEAADRILALPESDRHLALKLAWQDIYVTTLLTSRSLVSAYAAMLNRACELRALDERLVLNALPFVPSIGV